MEEEEEQYYKTFGNVSFYVPHANLLSAAVGARFSRTSNPTNKVLKEFTGTKEGRSIHTLKRIVLDYGHNSVAELAPVSVIIADISIYGAMFLKMANPLFSMIEESTRYIDFSNKTMFQGSPAEMDLMKDTIAFYEKAKPVVLARLKTLHDRPEGVKEKDYESAMEKATLDVIRDVLPQGIHTRFALHCNARAFASLLHPSPWMPQEVKDTIAHIRTGFAELYPAFAHWIEAKYDPHPHFIPFAVGAPFLPPETPSVALIRHYIPAEADRPESLPDLSKADYSALDDECRLQYEGQVWHQCEKDGYKYDQLHEVYHFRTHRFDALDAILNEWTFTVGWNVPFAAFRDLDRHRPHILKRTTWMSFTSFYTPPIFAECGLMEEWDSLLERIRAQRSPYCLPMCTAVQVSWKIGLGELIHILELRSTAGAHPIVRTLAQSLTIQCKELCPDVAAHVFADMSPNTPNFNRV